MVKLKNDVWCEKIRFGWSVGRKNYQIFLSSSLRSVKYNETESISPTEKDQSKNDTTAKINQEENIYIILQMIFCKLLIMLHYLVKCAKRKRNTAKYRKKTKNFAASFDEFVNSSNNQISSNGLGFYPSVLPTYTFFTTKMGGNPTHRDGFRRGGGVGFLCTILR